MKNAVIYNTSVATAFTVITTDSYLELDFTFLYPYQARIQDFVEGGHTSGHIKAISSVPTTRAFSESNRIPYPQKLHRENAEINNH